MAGMATVSSMVIRAESDDVDIFDEKEEKKEKKEEEKKEKKEEEKKKKKDKKKKKKKEDKMPDPDKWLLHKSRIVFRKFLLSFSLSLSPSLSLITQTQKQCSEKSTKRTHRKQFRECVIWTAKVPRNQS